MAHRSERRLHLSGLIAVGGAAAFAVLMFASNVANAAAAELAVRGGDPGSVEALDAFGDMMRHLNALGGAVIVGATTAGLSRARLIPPWFGALGWLVAALFLIGGAGFPGTSLEVLNAVAFPFLLIWPLTSAIVLLRHDAR
jgi:hypothetical protein